MNNMNLNSGDQLSNIFQDLSQYGKAGHEQIEFTRNKRGRPNSRVTSRHLD